MKRNTKLSLIKFILSIFVIIVGSFWVYHITMNGLYSMGADTIFKPSDNCKKYKELYIAEMKKGQPNNTSNIIEESKKHSCKK